MRISHVHIIINDTPDPYSSNLDLREGKKEKKCICCELFIVKLQRRERCFNEFICMEMHYSGAFGCS